MKYCVVKLGVVVEIVEALVLLMVVKRVVEIPEIVVMTEKNVGNDQISGFWDKIYLPFSVAAADRE